VDAGSGLFQIVMRSVPVLAPKNHAYVSNTVRDASLASMLGVPQEEDPDEKEKTRLEDEEAESAQRQSGSINPPVLNQPSVGQAESAKVVANVAVHVRKRKFYEQPNKTDVEWFPHEIGIELVKELVWEAGCPRWVLIGTPASGAALHGSFEMGCSVVALCYDDHHRTHLLPAILLRAVEAMASQSSMVFKDDVLHARSLELNLGKLAPAPKKNKKKKEKLSVADEDSDEDSDASPKLTPPRKKKKKKVASRSSSDSSDSSSKKPTQKKANKKLGRSLKCKLKQGKD
jgi:hypothetical protein